MTEDEDLDGLAAEYVLGSLSPAERREVDMRRKHDAELDRAIAAWERRLGPLATGVPGIEPPPELFAGIACRLWGGDSAPGATVVAMRTRGRGRQRAYAAIGLSALAACLVLALGWLLVSTPAAPSRLVAELHKSDGAADEGTDPKRLPALRVLLDLDTHSMTVTPMSLRVTPKRSFQLWLLPSSGGRAISLGLISHAAPTKLPWRRDFPTSDLVDNFVAVSLEPEGGSPTGAPTGPVLFIGKLAPAPAP